MCLGKRILYQIGVPGDSLSFFETSAGTLDNDQNSLGAAAKAVEGETRFRLPHSEPIDITNLLKAAMPRDWEDRKEYAEKPAATDRTDDKEKHLPVAHQTAHHLMNEADSPIQAAMSPSHLFVLLRVSCEAHEGCLLKPQGRARYGVPQNNLVMTTDRLPSDGLASVTLSIAQELDKLEALSHRVGSKLNAAEALWLRAFDDELAILGGGVSDTVVLSLEKEVVGGTVTLQANGHVNFDAMCVEVDQIPGVLLGIENHDGRIHNLAVAAMNNCKLETPDRPIRRIRLPRGWSVPVMLGGGVLLAQPINAIENGRPLSWPNIFTSISGLTSSISGLVSIQMVGNAEVPDPWKIGNRVVTYILFVGFIWLFLANFKRDPIARREFFGFVGKITVGVFSAHRWISKPDSTPASGADSFQGLDYLVLVLIVSTILDVLLEDIAGGVVQPRQEEQDLENATMEQRKKAGDGADDGEITNSGGYGC